MGKERTRLEGIVIPVMGPTGVGKSTFINVLLGEDRMFVNNSLSSCTKRIATAKIMYRGRCLVLVDTPGFDDTHESDFVILKTIADWLKTAYNCGAVIGGIVYLHDISMNRFTGTARQTLRVFNSICGEAALEKVVIGTTRWGNVAKSAAKHHVKELEDRHWRSMLDRGASVYNLEAASASAAFGLIDTILRKQAIYIAEQGLGQSRTYPDAGLAIQKEMAIQRKTVPETEAGKALRSTLKQVLLLQEQMLGIEKRDHLGAMEEFSEKQRELDKLVDQIQVLKISLPKRFRAFMLF